MPVVRPIGHEERLSIVDHLDELRNRLIAVVVVFMAAFAVCYWQNAAVLDIVNRPLVQSQHPGKGNDALEQAARYDTAVGKALDALSPALRATQSALGGLAGQPGVSDEARAKADAAARRLAGAAAAAAAAARGVPRDTGRRPVTLGVTEPFVTTFTVAGYAALLLALPFILWQAYAFILPAFAPGERRVALPLMALVPVLFAAGVAFGYYVALPRAVDFLQNFNDDAFDILIQARDYYRFVVLFIGVMGLVFQIPVGVLAITRTGLVSARGLWQRQGYVILGIAVVAAVATPTPDPVTMLVTMLPLVLLYWLSVGLAYIFQPRGPGIRGRWDEWWDDEPEEGGGPDDDDDGPGQGGSSDGPDDDLGGESVDGDGGRLATVGGDGADGMPPALRLGTPAAPLDAEPPADSVDVEEPVSYPGAREAPVGDAPVGAGPAADSPAPGLERAAAVEEDEAAASLDVDGPRPSLS